MVDWSGPQTSRNRSHGTVKHSVKLLGVGATAPDWCAVLCSRVDQCQGGDFQGLGSGSSCGSRKAADQGVVVKFSNKNIVIHSIKCLFKINEDTYGEFSIIHCICDILY